MAWNLRVSAALHQGDRKYMEDQYAIHYECNKESGKFLYVYFGIFDGHGGQEAAKYAKTHLHKNVTSNSLFWSDNQNDILEAIEAGFLKTHEDMWKELGDWPKTATGLPSTAGTTGSIVFIKGGKLYIGHVGDSGISLGVQSESLGRGKWLAHHLTVDHKPDSPPEKTRIENMGGKVLPKAGVHRVVWSRPRYKGPLVRPSQVDHIPFLAVSRALGDLWSYNIDNKEYAISPKPDLKVLNFDPQKHKCLVLASDGLWNLLDAKGAVATIEMTDRKWFREALYEKGFPKTGDPYYHHASTLVNTVLRRWRARKLRADNTSAIVVMIDPEGPSVYKSVDKLANLAHQVRDNGEKFCAKNYLKENADSLTDSEKYVLGMAGPYNIQYYDDADRFELMFGKPNVRHNRPKGADTCNSTCSIAMYDVIIHKVVTPAKSSSNLQSLISPHRFNNLRRTQSSRELRLFRPPSYAKNGSWVDQYYIEPPTVKPEVVNSDLENPDNLPLFIDEDENTLKKSESELVQEDQAPDSPEADSSASVPDPDSVEAVEVRCISPDSTSLCSPPPRPSTSSTELPQSSGTGSKIIKCLKGVAQSLVSLNDTKVITRKSSRIESHTSTSTSTVKTSQSKVGNNPVIVFRKPLTIPVTTATIKIKRKTSSVDLNNTKKRKLSSPVVQLTKVTAVSSPPSLRPRSK